MKEPMKIPVTVEFIRTFNNGWSLISCNLNPFSEFYTSELEDEVAPYIHKQYNTFTVTATIPEDSNGMQGAQYVFFGEFQKHPKYGAQFKADFFYQDVPKTEEGLIAFLMSLPNIKQARSTAIVNKFGVDGTFEIMDNQIYRLTEINGITTERIPAIEEAWKKTRNMRELYNFLTGFKLSSKATGDLAQKIYKKWGDAGLSIIQDNPYKLTEIRGVGFIKADEFAHSISEVSPLFRTVACIRYVLYSFGKKNSNLCLPYAGLKSKVVETIKECDTNLGNRVNSSKYGALVPSVLKSNLNEFAVVKNIKTNQAYVYLKEVWDKERFIAKALLDRVNYAENKWSCSEENVDFAEKGVSKHNGRVIKLDETQREAIKTVFSNKFSIITGAGGTGKSMICRCIFEIAQKKGLSIKMMSPTGKASQVLEAKTGCGATTIHRGLKLLPGDSEPQEDISQDILLVDEISMCGIDTIYAMMKAVESNVWCNIVFVGDKNQLPSVSPGNFLSDIIASKIANVVTLDRIHRQSENSYISLLANDISNGKVVGIPKDASDITWRNLNVDTFEKDLINFIDDYLESGGDIKDLQIMSPMKKGDCGVFKINDILQEKMAVINGTVGDKLERDFNKFFVGDRVIQVENNYQKMIFNGDMGAIVELGEKVRDPKKSDKVEKYLVVSFYGNEIEFYGDEINQLHVAWCITVHKFQGSQSPNIVLIIANEAQIMMSKELVYTAFTRAERQLDIYGHNNVFRMAPTKSAIKKRYTNFPAIVEELRTGKRVLKELEA